MRLHIANSIIRSRAFPIFAEYGDDRQVLDLEYDGTRLHQQSDIVDTLICPQDNAADNDSNSEYDEVTVFKQVSNTINNPPPAQPSQIGVNDDSDWDGEIDFETDETPSALITAIPDRLGADDVLDKKSDKDN